MKFSEIGELHSRIDTLEREISVLNAKHTALFYHVPRPEEKRIHEETMYAVGNELKAKIAELKKLQEL